jgi:hypothetical protein
MRIHITAIATLVAASALSISAQSPQAPPQAPQTQPRPAETRPGDTTQRADAATSQAVTVTGCLKKEKDVAGLTPNPAERVGVTDDYILTAVKMAQSSTVSGLAVSSMYEVEGIAEAELQKHLNHQVELTGQIEGAPTADDRTPNFRATSLKMVAATCPAAQ